MCLLDIQVGVKIWQSDNGGEFISTEIKDVIAKLGGIFIHGRSSTHSFYLHQT